MPQDCCMIPIHIRDKIVGMLYVDSGNSAVLDAGVSRVNSLVAMAAISFEIVILRKKLFDL
jgi:transcriptional regulator with GAF, ATPase, and Fis domain